MRKMLLSIAAGVALAGFASAVQAAGTLVYGFESGVDGFGGNGFPGTPVITQDTIGATQGDHSLKVAIPANGTFVGALTGNVFPPNEFGNPPGVSYVLFDLTIADGGAFTGAFADLGVTIFGSRPADNVFGVQAQFADLESLGGKTAGTYLDVRIDLNNAGGKTYNEIFGTIGAVAPLLTPSGLQLFVSKSGDAPLTYYVDNIRLVVPEPATGALLGLGALALGLVARRRA